MHPYPQTPVSRAVWPWNQPLTAPPAPRTGAGHLLVQTLAGYTLAGLALWFLHAKGFAHWKSVGVAAISFTTFLLILGFVAPPLHRRIVSSVIRLVLWAGTILTAILLPALYFLVVIPIGLLRRLGGSDNLDRSFPAPPGSLWKTRNRVVSPDEYRRQI